MVSLFLSCRALSSPTICRFIPAHCPELTAEQLAPLAETSERMSFAQLREVWLLANQLSYDAPEKATESLTGDHLHQAMKQMRAEHSGVARSGKLGFAATA